MSHSKERHEKNCLNCNTDVVGKYCHVCGQENIEPKETVWGLVNHFFADITHFDGKFFMTTYYLIAKPGILPKEYISGRRARFLHPIRMYVFCSAMFFLVFYSFSKFNWEGKVMEKAGKVTTAKLADAMDESLSSARTHADSVDIMNAFRKMDNILGTKAAHTDGKLTAQDSLEMSKFKKEHTRVNFVNLDDDDKKDYESVAAYDSVQNTLAKEKRDGWFKRMVKRRNITLQKKYNDNEAEFWHDVIEKFLHSFPYLLFISLPLYAIFLKLLYIRRKEFYYVDHGIFLIYLYIFTFIFLLAYFGTMKLDEVLHWRIINWIQGFLLLGGTYYAYKSIRGFYGQSRGKSIMKFVLLNICACLSLLLLFILFFTVAVMRI